MINCHEFCGGTEIMAQSEAPLSPIHMLHIMHDLKVLIFEIAKITLKEWKFKLLVVIQTQSQ